MVEDDATGDEPTAQVHINLPTSITILTPSQSPSATRRIGVFGIGGRQHGSRDIVPSDVEVVWFRSPRQVGATTVPKRAGIPEAHHVVLLGGNSRRTFPLLCVRHGDIRGRTYLGGIVSV